MASSCFADQVVSFVPWPDTWDQNDEPSNDVTSHIVTQPQDETKFAKLLQNHGLEPVFNVKTDKVSDKDIILSKILKPASTFSTSHYYVSYIPAANPILTVCKEGDPETLLVAEQNTSGRPHLWTITSPLEDIGDVRVFANSKRSGFYILRDNLEIAAVSYRKGAGSTFRCFDVMIPAIEKDKNAPIQISFEGTRSNLLSQVDQEVLHNCVKLSSREPEFKDGRYVLMFNGRVKRMSEQNFILCHPSQPARELLLCGKCADSRYVLDLNWPLSLLQAFAVYLTLFSKPHSR